MRTAIRASLLLLLGLLFTACAFADSQVRIVRLSLVDGPVQVDRGQGPEKAIMNMPITQGMTVETGDQGRAEVEFENGTTLRLAPRSTAEFPELSLRDSGTRVTAVQVNSGTAYFNVRHKDDDFRLLFSGREVSLNHNVHFRLDLASGNPELAVFNGELELKGDHDVKVKKNETLALDLSDAGRYDLAKNIIPESYDSWDSDRVNYANQYASTYNTRSPYSYGFGDLNYYGTWYSWPGYGTLWQPFGVGFGWNPFYNGAWSWYPGFGYTWVSTYPWGWAPYRYGSWVFVPNFGWAWRPGAWNTWYTVPPVYNAPVNFHPPQPPVTTTNVPPGHHWPTVIVNRPVPGSGFVAGSTPAAAASGATTITPATGTGVAAPGSPMPVRGFRAADRDDARFHNLGAGIRTAPTPRVDRSAPAAGFQQGAPAAHHNWPAGGAQHQGGPGVQHGGSPAHSSPAGHSAPAVHSAPSGGGGHGVSAPSSTAHPSK